MTKDYKNYLPITSISILMKRIEYMNEVLKYMDKILYSELNKEVCLKELKKSLKNIIRCAILEGY